MLTHHRLDMACSASDAGDMLVNLSAEEPVGGQQCLPGSLSEAAHQLRPLNDKVCIVSG